MDQTLFDQTGRPVAYLHYDYHGSIFLWSGRAVAYIHENEHVYGINGKHLGWFIDDVVYTNEGTRIGFTISTCPVMTEREPAKAERRPVDQIRPRWKAPPTPKLEFLFSDQDFEAFLEEGGVPPFDAGSETRAS